MGGVTGLDYSVLQMLFDLYDISNRKEVFEEVQIMEREGMRILNKEKK